jgi:hypothetical protein
MLRITIIAVLAFYAGIPFVFGQTTDCSVFHKGQFHIYFATSGQHSIMYRDDQTQKEVVDGSTDTLVWHINWLDSCDFTAQYIPNGTPRTKEQEKFFKKHKLYYHLQPGGKDFCVYTETVDNPGGEFVQKDTMWSHEISNPGSATIRLVGSESLLRGMRFSDTSSYAVIYFYRPLTGTFSGSSINIYAEDHVIFSMENSAHYILAVYRKGAFKLTGRFARDTCPISLNIEPGKSYYVRCKMDFGIFGSKNYKVILEPMPAEKGKKQFDRTFKRRSFWS